MIRPDYDGGSIVNLMSSIVTGLHGAPTRYPPLSHLDPATVERAENVVLFIVDGLGCEYLERNGRGGVLQSHLSACMTTVFPPTTATAITTFFTATAPQQHGLTGWFTYFRELGAVLAVLPFTARYGGESLGQAGIDAGALFRHVPVADLIKVPSHLVTPAWIAHSDFSRAHRGRAELHPYADLGQCLETVGRLIRDRRGRKYIHAYWPGLDSIGHGQGIGSQAAAAHLAEIDRGFARLLDRISGSRTLLLVTGDHGMIDTQPQAALDLDRHPDLSRSLTLPLCGEQRLAYCYVRSGRGSWFEGYVRERLDGAARLIPSLDLIEQGFFGSGPAHPELAHRIGDYVLAMNGNGTITDRVMGERAATHVGAHGGITETEMYVPLVVMES